MATLYVNSITGNDSNNGSTWSLAKKTLAGASSAATAGDTIYAHGIFSEEMPFTKSLTWIAFGFCFLDGTGISVTSVAVAAAGTKVYGVRFGNFADACIKYNLTGGSGLNVFGCWFDNAPYGINWAASNIGASINIYSCVFTRCATAGVACSGNAAVLNMYNSVFVGNAISLSLQSSVTSGNIFSRNLFRDAIMVSVGTVGTIAIVSNSNVYDFTHGKCITNVTDRTSLAAWQSAIGAPRDAESLNRNLDNDMGDVAKYAPYPPPSSAIWSLGLGGEALGLRYPAVTISNNKNASLWTGGVFSNTEINGSGDLVLSAGQTSGYWRSDIIDFGASIIAYKVEAFVTGETAVTYLDYDTGDSPGYLNVRVRGSNSSFLKTDASPSWVIVPRGESIGNYMSANLRYWQIELTLNGT